MDGPEAAAGMEALCRLKSTDAPLFLSPSEELAQAARVASQYLFSALKPFSSGCPLPHLVMDGFDAEQIWPQIEGQSEPLIKTLRNRLRKFEKNPKEIKKQFNLLNLDKKDGKKSLEREGEGLLEREIYGFVSEDDSEEDDEEEDKNADEDDAHEEEGEEGEGEEDEGKSNGVEDKFLKIKELEEYLVEDEAREYGLKREEKKKRKIGGGDESTDEDDEENDEEDDDEAEDEDEDELGLMGLDDGEDDEEDRMGNARYEDFFGVKKKSGQKKSSKLLEGLDDSDMDDEPSNDNNDLRKQNLSTYEKEQERLRSQIQQMEKANLGPKDWTMQGEVTAAKRAKNSALEVDIDFEHNVRPPPVITEEFTTSLEELIKKRILEGHFNDVEKPPTLPSRAPKEMKELDENKSKKGLAEVYEEEYVQKSGLVATALSYSDEQKKEASMLFKKLCLNLDALSHFHFTPKPVIEDMSIQANVPALAMEEIAPFAVSDAAMLAPEEVFAGKGDIKDESELTQEERKRRRAKKKRKFKAESAKRMAKKAQRSMLSNHAEGDEHS